MKISIIIYSIQSNLIIKMIMKRVIINLNRIFIIKIIKIIHKNKNNDIQNKIIHDKQDKLN